MLEKRSQKPSGKITLEILDLTNTHFVSGAEKLIEAIKKHPNLKYLSSPIVEKHLNGKSLSSIKPELMSIPQ